jgi:hypothetical protein
MLQTYCEWCQHQSALEACKAADLTNLAHARATCTLRTRTFLSMLQRHGSMLPWLRHSTLSLGQVMAPLTSAACGGRQMTLNGGWGLQNAGLWQRGRHTSLARASAAAPQPLVYQITDTTQLLLQRGNITLFEGDAIVNAGAHMLRIPISAYVPVTFVHNIVTRHGLWLSACCAIMQYGPMRCPGRYDLNFITTTARFRSK